MIIPVTEISDVALNAIIESFVLREGTDYGEYEISFAEKIAQVKKQLTLGLLVLVFSELHQTVNIMSKDKLIT